VKTSSFLQNMLDLIVEFHVSVCNLPVDSFMCDKLFPHGFSGKVLFEVDPRNWTGG